ncbi:hypothetical protein AB0G06_43445 [Nonomuraea dietziae]|uniref:hypothetical protein n=1 Tax=Nonomuraea dietziae TaxID=65515 RepID=UPI0033F9D2BA
MSRKKLIALVAGATVLVVAGAFFLIRWTSEPGPQDYIEMLKDHGYECESRESKAPYYAQCGDAYAAYFATHEQLTSYYSQWTKVVPDHLSYPHYGTMGVQGLSNRKQQGWWEVICTSLTCEKAAYNAKWADNRVIKFPKPTS